MPRVTVDGIEIEVPEGRTILQALDIYVRKNVDFIDA